MRIKLIFIISFLCSAWLFETANSQTTPFRTYSIEHGLSESVVHSMLQDEDGFIWLGTGFGLNRFDGVQFSHYYQEHGLPNNRVNSLLQDRTGRIWMGTDSGLAYLQNGKIYTPALFNPVDEALILSIFECRDHNIWIATEGDGLWKYDTRGEFTNVSHKHGYRNMRTRSITQTSDGVLWIGTSEGLYSFNGATFRKYRVQDGVAEVPMNDIKTDEYDNIWIASESGLIIKRGGEFSRFDEDAGLQNSILHSISLAEEGSAWVGSDNGFFF